MAVSVQITLIVCVTLVLLTLISKEFSINGDESRVIRFNPKDLGILTRMESTLSDFNDLEKKIKESNEDNFLEAFKDVESSIKEKINSIFNSDVYDIVFNGQSPLALVKGEFLFMRVINAIRIHFSSTSTINTGTVMVYGRKRR